MDNPLARQVHGAMRAVTGDLLLLVPSMGGSLTLHVLPDPFVIVPTVNHDNNQHSSDENLSDRQPLVCGRCRFGDPHDALTSRRVWT